MFLGITQHAFGYLEYTTPAHLQYHFFVIYWETRIFHGLLQQLLSGHSHHLTPFFVIIILSIYIVFFTTLIPARALGPAPSKQMLLLFFFSETIFFPVFSHRACNLACSAHYESRPALPSYSPLLLAELDPCRAVDYGQ